MAVKIGDKAPEFSLYSSDKELISLSDLIGKKTLLLFFPLAFTGVCTTELCSLRDDIASYNDVEAQVIGISVDTVFTLDKFKAEQSLNFTLLSDFNKEVSRAYGCLHETFVMDMRGVSKRSAFVIGKDGVIRYAEVLDNPKELPNFDAIKNILNS